MRRIAALGGAAVLIALGGAGYAAGYANLPKICDPADVKSEIGGQWGARLATGDCFDGDATSIVVVRDNDYAFVRDDCVVFATRSDVPVGINFREKYELVVTTAADISDDVFSAAACGPVGVTLIRTSRQSDV